MPDIEKRKTAREAALKLQRLLQHDGVIIKRSPAWVCCMAMVQQSTTNDFFKRLVLYTHLGQPGWQHEPFVHIPQRISNIATAAQPHGSGHAIQALFFMH